MGADHECEESGLPPAKRARTCAPQVLIRAKDAETTAEILMDRAWLESAKYFKEGLARWKGNTEVPTFDLILPEGAAAEGGLQLMKQRLSESQASSWSNAKWWKITDGDATLLLTALYIFDHIIEERVRSEVAETVDTFRVPCPQPYFSILEQVAGPDEIWYQESSLPSFKVDTETIKCLVEGAMGGKATARVLADRAIASHPVHDLVPVLWSACRTYDLVTNDMDVLAWLAFHVERIGARSPKAALDFLQLVTLDVLSSGKITRANDARSLSFAVNLAGRTLLNGILLGACKRNPMLDDEESARDLFAKVTELIEKVRTYLLQKESFSCRWDVELFQTLPPHVQVWILEPLQARFANSKRAVVPLLLAGFIGNVSIVAPEARHIFLRLTKILTDEDMDFLHTASFPALES